MIAPGRWFTNRALLLVVPGAVLTGLFANAVGTDWIIDPAVVHGVVGLGVVALTPWKSPIVERGMRRRRPGRWLSVSLAVFVAVTVASGLAHSTGTVASIGPLTIMQVHIGAAVASLALLFSHFRARPVGSRRADPGRRSFVATSVTAVAATTLWAVWESVLVVVEASGARRRFTGSHERGSGDPAAMPVTSWLDDAVQRIDSRTWRLEVDGVSVSYETLLAMSHEEIGAVLDCTSGWFAEQCWSGVRLSDLVEREARSVAVRSVTGYQRLFPARDLDRVWLVTGAGGQPLSAGHGFPARIVAPDRRGFWWVKWVGSIESTDRPWWLQLPFPAT